MATSTPSAVPIVSEQPQAPAAPHADTKRAERLYYKMMRQLPRIRGIESVSDLILRHAARAVDARLGAVAVAKSDAHASIVATLRLSPNTRRTSENRARRRRDRSCHADAATAARRGPDPMRPRRLRYRTNSFVAVPVLAGLDVLGAICVTDRTDDRPFTAADVTTLRKFAAGAALALERERALDSAEAHAHAAAIDPVSGVFNRRYLQVRLGEELQRSRRHEIPLALLLDRHRRLQDRQRFVRPPGWRPRAAGRRGDPATFRQSVRRLREVRRRGIRHHHARQHRRECDADRRAHPRTDRELSPGRPTSVEHSHYGQCGVDGVGRGHDGQSAAGTGGQRAVRREARREEPDSFSRSQRSI